MQYTVQKLSRLAGISPRTLRYYDTIGLLAPAFINTSGYRVYGTAELDRLQQILFYRELGLPLDEIKNIVNSPGFDRLDALKGQREKLKLRRIQLDILLSNIEKTIDEIEKGNKMTDNEKFEGFRQKMLDDNEQKYGKEIRSKYGDESITKSYQQFKNMTKQQYEDFEKLSQLVISSFQDAFKTGDPSGESAQQAAALHKKWITLARGFYSKEAHAGLAQMYVDDIRFTEYYDKYQNGLTLFIRDAIKIFTDNF